MPDQVKTCPGQEWESHPCEPAGCPTPGACSASKGIEALRAKLAAAEARMAMACEYLISEPSARDQITVRRRMQRDGTTRWSVCNGPDVLHADGNWVHEPLPSNRADDFIGTTRFDFETAWDLARYAALAQEVKP